MREHHALGRAGGAGGEDERRDVVGAAVWRTGADARRAAPGRRPSPAASGATLRSRAPLGERAAQPGRAARAASLGDARQHLARARRRREVDHLGSVEARGRPAPRWRRREDAEVGDAPLRAVLATSASRGRRASRRARAGSRRRALRQSLHLAVGEALGSRSSSPAAAAGATRRGGGGAWPWRRTARAGRGRCRSTCALARTPPRGRGTPTSRGRGGGSRASTRASRCASGSQRSVAGPAGVSRANSARDVVAAEDVAVVVDERHEQLEQVDGLAGEAPRPSAAPPWRARRARRPAARPSAACARR